MAMVVAPNNSPFNSSISAFPYCIIMALISFNIAIPMLLLSMVAFASATATATYGGYGPKPDLKKPYLEGKEKVLPSIVGIEGLVYCKSGPKLIPLKGAVARITCLAVDEQGYKTAPFSFLSNPADKKGYYFATLSPSQLENNYKLTQCKAFLEYSPLETCKVPTDVNKGITGSPLSSYTLLKDKKMKLYSVKPFFYTSEPKPTVSNGY